MKTLEAEKANKRLWILRRLVKMGASVEDLLDVYILQIRCVLEYAVPVWQGSISQNEKEDIERKIPENCMQNYPFILGYFL